MPNLRTSRLSGLDGAVGWPRPHEEEIPIDAVERALARSFVQADHGDTSAIGLYTNLGVREDVLHFDIPVPRED